MLFLHFFLCLYDDGLFDFIGNHYDAVEISKDQVARFDQYPAAANRHVVCHDHPTPHGIERTYAGVVDGETHLDDLVAVANLAVADTSHRAVTLGHRAHKSAPRSIRTG